FQYDYFFENGPLPDLADVTGNTPIASTSSSASGALHTQEDQTNMLLHNVSKIERLAEREASSATRTSRFIPQLRRRTHSKRGAVSSDTYSGESVLVSESQSLNQSHNATMSLSNKNKNKHKRKSLQSSINLNQTITKLISAPHNMHNALLKYNATSTNSTTNNKTITQSTPNICVAAATPASKPLKQCASANRQQQQPPQQQQMQKQQLQQRRRKAVPTIYDFGLTLRVQFQSLDSTKSATTAMTTSSSSTNATTASSSSSSVITSTQKTKKERSFLINHGSGGFVRLHHRKASLDEKDSGSCSGSGSGSGGSMSKEQQRSSVDISVLLTDDESSNSRSDT
ncbi:PREDICTED: uncharacterized protein DDB_G0271670-like, partial [Rhagoletis zephyria]|uniref:uncharacterized protein DDB_G0271670-like n=1 Tax=Rhagoletis zephyria TaxID=28612 RepID=UPI0008114352